MPLIEIAGGIASNVAVAAAQPLLVDLMGVQDQQLQKLTAIQADVRRLLEGPWRRARVLVSEAAETADDDPQRTVYLHEARQALFEAYGLQPDIHPCRAAIAVELAIVLGLLGRRQDCERWSATAHEEAVAFVTARIPRVQSAINQRGRLDALRWNLTGPPRDVSDPEGTKGPKDFWKPLVPSLYWKRDEPESKVAVEVTRRAFETGVWPSREIMDFDGPYKRAAFAVSGTRGTRPGRQLLNLHEAASEAESYRRIRVKLQPTLKLPRYRLAVDLSTPYEARIAWEEASLAV